MKGKMSFVPDIFDYDEALGDVLSILRDLYTKGYTKRIENTAIEKALLDVLAPGKFDSMMKNGGLIDYKNAFAECLNILYELYNNGYIDMVSLDRRMNENLKQIIQFHLFDRLLSYNLE